MKDNPYWYWPQCDVEGCEGVSCNGGTCWRETGYWSVCPQHSREYREGKPQPQMKRSAIDRENSRDENGILPNDVPNAEVSDTTGDHSSNVADKQKYEEQKARAEHWIGEAEHWHSEALRLADIINEQYSLSEEEIVENVKRWFALYMGNDTPDKMIADFKKTIFKDKEGIDVASDSKPDETLLATLGSDSGNSMEHK